MAHILIDGYNLIGTAHRDLEKARNKLIETLSKYSKAKAHNITVVFDGWKEGKVEETVTRLGGVRVIYSRLAEKADSVIMRIILEEKRPWIVVSSDREIADFTIRHDLVSVTSEEFEGKLYSSRRMLKGEYVEGGYGGNDEEVDFPSLPKKGNPRKISKSQRRKLQALKKL